MNLREITWPTNSPNEIGNPFVRGVGERPLRLTLHYESHSEMDEENKKALEVIDEIANMPEFEVVGDISGKFPVYDIQLDRKTSTYIPVVLKDHKGTSTFGINIAPHKTFAKSPANKGPRPTFNTLVRTYQCPLACNSNSPEYFPFSLKNA